LEYVIFRAKFKVSLQPEVERYFLALAACHSVQIAQDQTKGASHLEYQASSPDEKALVEVAQRYMLIIILIRKIYISHA